MEDFSSYILNERNFAEKLLIAYYMSKKTGIFFDKSIVLRAQIGKMFLSYSDLDVDKNEVLTEIILCNCKKIDNPQKLGKLETYAKEGADYLASLGFDKKFCHVCEGLNRYIPSEPREKESDILELVDQFTGLILRRPEREAFTPKEALIILKERNLKNKDNRYLEDFILFVEAMENVYIRESIEVAVIRKLTFLAEKEPNAKTFIAVLANKYSAEIDRAMHINIKQQAEKLLYNNIKKSNTKTDKKTTTKEKTNYIEPIQKVTDNVVEKAKNKIRRVHRYTRIIHKENSQKALFSKEVADRIMNHKSIYKIES